MLGVERDEADLNPSYTLGRTFRQKVSIYSPRSPKSNHETKTCSELNQPFSLCRWNFPYKVTAVFGQANVGCGSRILCHQWGSVRPNAAWGRHLLEPPYSDCLKGVYTWDHEAAACWPQQVLVITVGYTAGVGERGAWIPKLHTVRSCLERWQYNALTDDVVQNTWTGNCLQCVLLIYLFLFFL